MKKLGIAIKDLGASQLNYHIIKNVNRFLSTRYDVDIIAFFENFCNHSFMVDFACMQANELWGYDGDVVATNLQTAENLINIPTIKNKYFYIWNLEWTTSVERNFLRFNNIYNNPELKILCRPEHKYIIQKLWNVNIYKTIKDFNINEILDDRNK